MFSKDPVIQSAPSLSVGFLEADREYNLNLFRTLIENMPDQPLEHPVNKFDPALALQRHLLKFAESTAGLSADYFYTFNSKSVEGLTSQQAIDCLKDVVRTKRFLQAIDRSVQELAKDRDTVNVLDAGCGPMAVFGIFAALVSDKVRCTCLEINKPSAAFASTMIGAFGLEDRVVVQQADATKFESDKKFDLIISETMYTAFIGEPIIEIFKNLSRYLNEDGKTLPSAVDYKVGFLNSEDPTLATADKVQFGSDTDSWQRHSLDSWETIFTWQPGQSIEKIEFTHPFPNDSSKDFFSYVGCTVHLGDGIKLEKFDSNISYPLPLVQSGMIKKVAGAENKDIRVCYRPGSRIVNPCFELVDKVPSSSE